MTLKAVNLIINAMIVLWFCPFQKKSTVFLPILSGFFFYSRSVEGLGEWKYYEQAVVRPIDIWSDHWTRTLKLLYLYCRSHYTVTQDICRNLVYFCACDVQKCSQLIAVDTASRMMKELTGITPPFCKSFVCMAHAVSRWSGRRQAMTDQRIEWDWAVLEEHWRPQRPQHIKLPLLR